MAILNDPVDPTAVVKVQSAAPAAGDKALTVLLHPNSAAPAPTGTTTIAGNKTDDAAAPGATNVGAMVAVGNAAAPTTTEGNLTFLSVDLANTMRSELTKVAGTATSTAAAGVQKVGIVGNAGAACDAVAGAAAPANVLYMAGRAATANPTNETGGDATPLMLDKAGRIVTTLSHVRELVGIQTTNIVASTVETTIITAGGANVFNDISCLIISTTNAVAATVTIKDAAAGTTRMVFDFPPAAATPADPIVIPFPVPAPQAAANQNWTATVSVNAGSVKITAVFVKNL